MTKDSLHRTLLIPNLHYQQNLLPSTLASEKVHDAHHEFEVCALPLPCAVNLMKDELLNLFNIRSKNSVCVENVLFLIAQWQKVESETQTLLQTNVHGWGEQRNVSLKWSFCVSPRSYRNPTKKKELNGHKKRLRIKIGCRLYTGAATGCHVRWIYNRGRVYAEVVTYLNRVN